MKIAVAVERDLRGTGFGTRVISMIRHYSQRNQVSLIQIGTPSEAFPDFLRNHLDEYFHIPSTPGRVRSHLSPRPSRVVRCEMAFVQALQRGLPLMDRHFDVVQAETVNMWFVAKAVQAARRVLVLHDDDAARLRTLTSAAASPLRRALYVADSLKYGVYQRRAANQADQCWFVSEVELKRFSGLRSSSVFVPNGAPDEFYTVPEATGSAEKRILFVGPAQYEANRQGIAWFLQEVWPLVRQHSPAARLRLVGTGWCDQPTQEGVERPGFVADLGQEHSDACVVIAPLFAGGGTNLKVVEAMASGRAVVATSMGARGIPNSHGLIVRDDPRAFASEINRLLDDREHARECGRVNREVATDLKWSSIWDKALGVLQPGL